MLYVIFSIVHFHTEIQFTFHELILYKMNRRLAAILKFMKTSPISNIKKLLQTQNEDLNLLGILSHCLWFSPYCHCPSLAVVGPFNRHISHTLKWDSWPVYEWLLSLFTLWKILEFHSFYYRGKLLTSSILDMW